MRAIRIECFQNMANYRKPTSFTIKESYPLPPYSTVIGMIHSACGFKTYHPMKVSVQGKNTGSISEMYTRYTFANGRKYENDRHNIKFIYEGKEYGAVRGIGYVELICSNKMIFHIIPENPEEIAVIIDGLKHPKNYVSLGRYEDLLDITNIEEVDLKKVDKIICKNDIYVPVKNIVKVANDDFEMSMKSTYSTVYVLNKEFEITKKSGRRWKAETGKVKVIYCPLKTYMKKVLADKYYDVAIFA